MTPKKVAIVGMGVSNVDYILDVCRFGSRFAIADEVWAINKMGAAIQCDAIFRMDDLGKDFPMNQKAIKFGEDNPKIIQDVWYDTLKAFKGKIFTSKAYPDLFPTSVEYPIEDVINFLNVAYFNTGPSYAIAYAMMIGVEELLLYGLDYTYPDRHIAESGRACVEFHLRDAMRRGVKVTVSKNSTLLDTNKPTTLYGYDTPVNVVTNEDGKLNIVWRTDIAKKQKEEQERAEHCEFQRLAQKFKPDLLDTPDGGSRESLIGEQK